MYEGRLRVHHLGRVPMKYRSFARKKLEELYAQAEGGSLTKYFRTGTGCLIKVAVVGDDGYIRVKCGACPKLIHGLMDPIVDASHPNALYEDTIDGEVVETFHRFYEKDATDWANVTSLRTSGPQSLTKRPGLYSGLMRKVVQALLASNQEVPYNYTFATTHGVYVAADGSHHVIEISSSGIFTWPLPACGASESVTGLSYTPLNEARPASPLQIADASVVAAAYGKSPLFSGCGWAFSYNGSKASNVVYTTSGSYYVAYLYTITISGDENSPTSASMSEVENDYLWGDRVTHIKVPDYNEATLTSFDWTTTPSEPGSSSDTPVFCWYPGGETLRVCRFIRIPSASFSSTSDTIEYYLGGSSSLPIPGGTAETISGTQETRSFSISGFVDAAVSRTYTGTETIAVELDRWSGVYAQNDFNTGKSYTDVIAAGWRARTSVDVADLYIEALVIAYGDREAVFHARQRNKDGTADEEVTQIGFYGYGSWYGTTADSLHGGAVDWTAEVAAGDITAPAGADSTERAHNRLNEIGSGTDVGGVAGTLTLWDVFEHVGYFYGLSGTPEMVGAAAYATQANEDAYGGDPCFTGTTRLDDTGGYSQFTLQNFQSYISYSTTPPCTGPAETVGTLVYEVSQYWFGNVRTVFNYDYASSSTPVTIEEETKEAVLIRNSGSTSIDAGISDFTTTWCEFLETTAEVQVCFSLPDCVGSKSAYLNGIYNEYATFPDDMLGGGTYPITEISSFNASFIGNP